MLTLVLFKMHFSIIEFNYEVTYLSIFVMYDVQCDVVEYGSKIN
jgi:hypothetical protein